MQKSKDDKRYMTQENQWNQQFQDKKSKEDLT